MVITFCFDDTKYTEKLTIDKCEFKNNTCKGTAVIYFANGASAEITDTSFIDNTVTSTGNVATVYVGGAGNNYEVSGCTFKGNDVSTSAAWVTKIASAIYLNGGTVNENVFDSNTATRVDTAISNVVYVTTSAWNKDGKTDLGKNYWDGKAPVPGVDYTGDSTNSHAVTVADYYASYDAENGLADLATITYVAKVGNYSYTTLADAFAAVTDGSTLIIYEGTYDAALVINKSNVTVIGEGDVTLKGIPSIKGTNYKVENIDFVYSTGSTNLSGSGLIKDCTFTATATDGNTFRYCYGTKDAAITFEGCTITAPMWAIHFDSAPGLTLNLTDCEINGRVALGGDLGALNATETTFENGYVNVWGTEDGATFTECVFVEVPYIFTGYDADNTFNFNKCTTTVDGATKNVTDIIWGGNDSAAAEIYVDYVLKSGAAKIGDTYYKTLADAIAAVKNGDNTITLLKDISEEVTIKQVEGVNIVIDGNEKEYSGTFTIHGNARYTGAETLTFQNIKFVTDEASHYFIDSNSTGSVERYAHNVTVEDCTFTATGEAVNSAVAMRIRQGFNISIKGVETSGLHSALQAYGNNGITVDRLTITSGKNGISVGTSTDVTITEANITATGYGIRADGTDAYDMTVKDCTISAELPIVVRNATGAYELTLEGTNKLTAQNTDGYQVIFTTGDDGTYLAPTEPVNLTGAENLNTFPVFEAQAGDYSYTTLAAAIAAAQAGDTITLLGDVTESGVILVNGVTLNLNGNTLTANYVIALNGNYIADYSDGKTGRINCDVDKISMPVDNGDQMPLWIEGEGYAFATVKIQNYEPEQEDNELSLVFRPSFGTKFNEVLAEDYNNSEGISIIARVEWDVTDSDGNVISTVRRDYVCSDMLVNSIYTNDTTIDFVVSNMKENVKISIVVVSKLGVTIEKIVVDPAQNANE